MQCTSDITDIMATSRNWYELVWAWQGWRDESGKKMPDMYQEFVHYQNQAAILNGKRTIGLFNKHILS
jgi:peptidyl-dipeptidase A